MRRPSTQETVGVSLRSTKWKKAMDGFFHGQLTRAAGYGSSEEAPVR
jgi:hypothetical protein